jgi:hypothetical protein
MLSVLPDSPGFIHYASLCDKLAEANGCQYD